MTRNIRDRTSEVIGMLTVLELCPERNRDRKAVWLCLCECGNLVKVNSSALGGRVVSCGCRKFLTGSNNPNWKGYGEISKAHWNSVMSGAEARNISMTLSIQEAWQLFLEQDRKCALSGVPLKFASRGTEKTAETTASLDRIDSSQGYIVHNVQWIHKKINSMKLNMSDKELIEWSRAIAVYQDNSDNPVKN